MRMMPIKLEVDVAGTIAGLQRVAAALALSRAASTQEYCEDLQAEAVLNLKANNTDFIGTLRRSIEVDQIPDGHRMVVGAQHGSVIEFGRRPAGIPIEVVLDDRAGLTFWVRKKMRPVPGGDDPEEQLRAKRRIRARGKTIKARTGLKGRGRLDFYEGVAIAISKKKAKTRQEPKPFVVPAIEKLGGPERLKDIAVKNFIQALK